MTQDQLPERADQARRQVVAHNEALPIPAPVDVLVVGGGPGGVAAAFQAHDLGRSVLLMEGGELLSSLIEWSYSPKPVVSRNNNREASQMPFPHEPGALVRTLPYEDCHPLELYVRWLGAVASSRIAVRSNTECLGLERGEAGTWTVRTNRSVEDGVVHARVVVLAVGGGAPRRLQIPGDAQDIAGALLDPSPFVGGAACVIGGGNSAVEAVLGISEAKHAKGDESKVYWSYRSSAIPQVAEGLSGRFFRAFTVHGNILPLPSSSVASVVARDGQNYVLLRRDEHRADPGASDSFGGAYFMFPKKRVIACIGRSGSSRILEDLERVVPEEDEDPVLVVRPWLESLRPRLYVVGEALGPLLALRQTEGDAGQEILKDRTSSFKQSIWDGVLAASAAHAQLDGSGAEKLAELVNAKDRAWREDFRAESRRSTTAGPRQFAVLESLDDEGHGIGKIRQPVGTFAIHRETGEVWPGEVTGEDFVVFTVRPEGCSVRDELAAEDTLIRTFQQRVLSKDELFFAGNIPLRIIDSGHGPILGVLDEKRTLARAVPVPLEGCGFGREERVDETGQVLAQSISRDSSVSRRHFHLEGTAQGFQLTNHSQFGVFVAVDARDTLLMTNEVLFVRYRQFRYLGMESLSPAQAAAAAAAATVASEAETARVPVQGEAEVPTIRVARPSEESSARPRTSMTTAQRAPTAEPSPVGVEVRCDGAAFPAEAGTTIYKALKRSPILTDDRSRAAARQGLLHYCGGMAVCGECVVRIKAGGELLSRPKRAERARIDETVKERLGIADAPEGEYRLACKCAIDAAVEIELLGDTSHELS